ncbi:MAG: hypothetical protein KIG65_04120 [Eubacteriales bacterium]|nr:hypothetical protein [Eubacteriales bacterium]
MLDRFKNMRIFMKLFSVVLAVIIWLVLIYTVDPVISQSVKNVQVTFQGEDVLAEKGLVLVGKEDADKVNVKIRGARRAVINSLSLITAYVNVSDIDRAGSWSKTVSFNLGVSGVSVDGRVGETITVQTEELVDKKVPVKIAQLGTDKNKDIIVSSVPENEDITLRGAKSELANIKAVVVPVDVSAVSSDMDGFYKYHFIDNNDSLIKPQSLVNPDETIRIINNVYKRKTVDVNYLLSKDRDKYMLEVKASTKTKIDIGIIDESVEDEKIKYIKYLFNPADYKSSVSEYVFTADVPEGIYVPEESMELVAEVELKELIRTDINLKVDVRNIQQGKVAVVRPDEISLTVRAPAGVSEKIKAYVDASNLTSGTYELEVQTENDENVIFEEMGHVKVIISEEKG